MTFVETKKKTLAFTARKNKSQVTTNNQHTVLGKKNTNMSRLHTKTSSRNARRNTRAIGGGRTRALVTGNDIATCAGCASCGCVVPADTSAKVCCQPCACRPKKGIRQFRQGIVMTGCGKPPGACGFDPSLTCGQADTQLDFENAGAPSTKFGEGSWFLYRSIQLEEDPNDANVLNVLDDPIAKGPLLDPEDPLYQPATPMYPPALRGPVNFLYESWIDPCTCTWWRLRYDSCGRPEGYEPKEYESAAELEMALRELRGFDSDTNNNEAAENYTSFVVAGVPSQVNLDLVGSTPPVIVTGADYGYQVFVLDTAVGRYYRDPNNVQCTKPFFPNTCCDGAQFKQYYFSGEPKCGGVDTIELDSAEGDLVNCICYEFSAETCRWYVCDIQAGADLDEEVVELCILQCCWSGCRNKIGINSECPDALDKPSLCCAKCCP